MSLINRMLRDLSSRQPAPGDVMTGIQLPNEGGGGGMAKRLGLLVVLIVVFTTGLWFVFGPKSIKAPQPLGMPGGATTASAPAASAAAPAPAPSAAPAAAQQSVSPAGASAQLQIATELHAAPAKPAARKPRAPRAASTDAPRQAAPTAPASAAASTAGGGSAEEFYAQARRALDRGDGATAEPLLGQALALDPKLHAAREDLASLRIRENRLDDAETTIRVGLDLDPSRRGYRKLVARVELARNRPGDAVAVLERDPPPLDQDLEYYGLLASAYQRIGRHDAATRLYRELMRAEPQEANWWAGYAMSRDAEGDVAGALVAYSQARQLGGLAPNVLEHIDKRTAALQAGR
jgi:MSHA biogenesis protein MshN